MSGAPLSIRISYYLRRSQSPYLYIKRKNQRFFVLIVLAELLHNNLNFQQIIFIVNMQSKKNKDTIDNAINRLAESSERLEKATITLVYVTLFLLIFTLVSVFASYDHLYGWLQLLLAYVFSFIIVIIMFYVIIKEVNKTTYKKK